MKKNHFHFYIPLLVLAIITSCEQTITFEVDQLPKSVVVNCENGTDSVFMVNLSTSFHTSGYIRYTPITDALVYITEENGAVYLLAYRDVSTITGRVDDGRYESATGIYPQSGKKYTLTVQKEGYESIYAEYAVPVIVPLTEAVFSDTYLYAVPREMIGIPDARVGFYPIKVSIDDPAGENYYEIRVKKIVNDISNEEDQSGISIEELLSVSSLDPRLNSDTPEEVSERFSSQTGQVANKILFSDVTFEGAHIRAEVLAFIPSLVFSGSFSPLVTHSPAQLKIELLCVSKEYYLYHRTLKEYAKASVNPFAEPVNVYSNIENGLGFFGGYSVSSILIDTQNPENYE